MVYSAVWSKHGVCAAQGRSQRCSSPHRLRGPQDEDLGRRGLYPVPFVPKLRKRVVNLFCKKADGVSWEPLTRVKSKTVHQANHLPELPPESPEEIIVRV